MPTHAQAKPSIFSGQNFKRWRASYAWKHSDYLNRNYILSYLSDDLVDVYRTLNTVKVVWDALEYKYKTQDPGAKKFIVDRFLDFKMVDGKSLYDQVQELEVMFHEIHAEGMMLSDGFQAAAILEKLPPSMKDFKNYLKHKRKEMTVKELALRLPIEEDNRNTGVVSALPNPFMGDVKANVVEQGSASKTRKGKRSNFAPRRPSLKMNVMVVANLH
ncbi:hypothetical protein LIER_02770 [Lithospermum erythrorhizon]|uniref:Uncharacterized protein n=1 Tax=Lithospermum erythrorhizon TaxID=34254 RepID=A0AAV3NQN9_LITER